jgi:Fe-Mn family superoxide dismutase
MKNLRNKINNLEKQLHEQQQKRESLTETKKIEVEKLPYAYSALKQFIDPETMNVHYNRHYKGYVDKLNGALEKGDFGDLDLEQIVKTIQRFSSTIRNNAGGAYNHAIFWKMLSPKPTKPKGLILKKINTRFGSFESFKEQFETQAKDRFGSGWVWLVLTKRGTLKIMTTPNQDNPLMKIIKNGGQPLLGLDLWEHAYYLKYKNKRDEYIKNFWKVVNWDYVESELQKLTKKNINESTSVKEFILESVSEPCSKQELSQSRNLFNNNTEALLMYSDAIMSILAEIYPNKYYGDNEYRPKTSKGIYDLEKPGRSIINYLNTNFSTFCILMRDMNKVLERHNVPQISFVGKNHDEQVLEMDRMLSILNELKFRIFSNESKTFQSMMNKIGMTSQRGSNTEDIVTKKLKEKFGDENVEKVGELGSKEDMMGIDAKVNLDGKKLTVQIKPFNKLIEEDGMYKIVGSANVKRYKTDWMIFLRNNSEAVVFDNKRVVIKNGEYYFPLDSLLYQL